MKKKYLYYFLVFTALFIVIRLVYFRYFKINQANLFVLAIIKDCNNCKKADSLLRGLKGFDKRFKLNIYNLSAMGPLPETIKKLEKVTCVKITKMPILIIGDKVYQSETEIKNKISEIEYLLNYESTVNIIEPDLFFQ